MANEKTAGRCSFRRGKPAQLAATILAMLFAAAPALGEHDKTDVATTDDGNTFIGEIKSVQNATLELDTDAAGTLTIEWRRVTSLTSQFEYRLELAGGERQFGSLGPQITPGHLSILSGSNTTEVKLSDVFEIVPIEHKFWRRLDGSVDFGFSYTQANSTVQYNLSADARYRTRKNFAKLSAQSIFNTQEDGDTTNQHYLQFTMAQTAKKKWGAFEVAQIQANPDQGYNQRYVVGGGAAKFFIERSSRYFIINLGAVYNREYVADSSDVDNSAEAMAGFSFRQFKRRSHSPDLQLSLQAFPSMTESSRIRALANFKISWKIVKNFQFSFQVTDHYDSKPPGDDGENNDMSVITSIGYTF
jgi:hypothetical protein